MDDLERKARELLSEVSGWDVADMAQHLGSDVCLFTVEEALEAVRAAISLPESCGLASAARAGLPFIAHAFAQGVDGAEQAGRAIEAALAARPEVP